MAVPFLDLTAQYHTLQAELDAAVAGVMKSAHFILGETVAAFERAMASYIGCRHAIGVASGTDALFLSQRALGIGEGDEVITTPFTFVATAAAVEHFGARTVFADVDPVTGNIDPAHVAEKITPRTRAILPVHLYGRPVPMKAIMALAQEHGLVVIEDAAQAAGAAIDGRRVGSMGAVGCFSFYPTKNLGGAGDGGLVTTNDDAMAESLRLLRDQCDESLRGGQKYFYRQLGYNSRLDALQAAVLTVKLSRLDEWNARRARQAARYRELLAGLDLALPPDAAPDTHTYNVFTLRTSRRDDLQAHLRARQIGCTVYYPLPLHLQPALAHLGYGPGDFPEAEAWSREALSIPLFPEMTDEQGDEVAAAIREFFA